jgi:hypothetical protein
MVSPFRFCKYERQKEATQAVQIRSDQFKQGFYIIQVDAA